MAELKNIRIAISGIYDYSINELGSLNLSLSNAPDWVEKKTIYKVYRSASVLAAAVEKFKLLPLTHHHPQEEVNSVNFRDLVIGYTGENPFIDYIGDKDEVGIRSNVLLYDDEAQSAYARGEVQLSPGYKALFEWQKGRSPHGDEYDIVMKEINAVNHLALLPAGRGGDDARVLDAKPEHVTIFDMVRLTHDKEDANGAQHSDDNGQFVGNGNNGGEKKSQSEDTNKCSESEKQEISNTLKNTAIPMPDEIPFSSENYEALFKDGVESPIEHIKLGENQEAKLKAANRQNLLAPMFATLSDPSVIIKATNGTRIYAKSFIKDKKQRNIVSVIIDRDNLHISISTHEKREEQIIKKASKLLYQKPAGDHGTVRHKDVAEGQEPTADKAAETVHINNITFDFKKYKSIFEIVQGTVFDRYGA